MGRHRKVLRNVRSSCGIGSYLVGLAVCGQGLEGGRWKVVHCKEGFF